MNLPSAAGVDDGAQMTSAGCVRSLSLAIFSLKRPTSGQAVGLVFFAPELMAKSIERERVSWSG